jgi:hypothetical protein
MNGSRCDGLRAFISYSHGDDQFAGRIAQWFSKEGGQPIWDRTLLAGSDVREQLLTLMGAAHVFIALLTDGSMKAPWPQQEIGYAEAVGIPIVPVSDRLLPGGFGLIGGLTSVRVKPDWSDLEQRLAEQPWPALSEAQGGESGAVLATLARSPSDRVRLLIKYAKRAQAIGGKGILRQRGGFSSFCIPKESTADRVWYEYDRGSKVEHRLKWEERQVFEKQSRAQGCRLIIDPLGYQDMIWKRTRLKTLHAFLTDRETGKNIQAITHNREYGGSLTIFGDWWLSESFVPRPEGYREAIFTWHPGTVKQFVKEFDEQFEVLCRDSGVSPENSLQRAVEELDRQLSKSE